MTDVLVLCYHALSPDWPAALSTTPERFEEQLTWLVERRGYRGATFEQAVTRPPAPRTLAVTFDDGYRSVLELAKPIMDRLGIPGSIYVPTDWPGRGPMRWEGIDQWLAGPHEHEMSCLGWDELRGMAADGWEVGSHTRSHPHLTRLDDARLRDELEASKAACEDGLGAPCRSIAYPYGDVDARVTAGARAAGYGVAASLPKGRFSRGERLDWPRVGVYNADDLRRFEVKTAPALRRARSTPLWDLAARARRYARRP